jgi:hypothetical protein
LLQNSNAIGERWRIHRQPSLELCANNVPTTLASSARACKMPEAGF